MQQDKKRLKKLDFFSELEGFEDIMSDTKQIGQFSFKSSKSRLFSKLFIMQSLQI